VGIVNGSRTIKLPVVSDVNRKWPLNAKLNQTQLSYTCLWSVVNNDKRWSTVAAYCCRYFLV